MRTPRVLIALVIVLAGTSVVSATAQAPAPRDPTKPCPGATKPGCGDNYLESVPITLSRISPTLQGFSDSVDTRTATTQADLFKPGGSGVGPRETTSCDGTAYGKTIWYDLNPTVDGDVLVQGVGAGFNPVISLVRYDVRGRPNFPPLGRFSCSNQGAGPLEQLQEKGVRRGRGYSIQIGGVGNTGGPLEVDVNVTPYRVRATPKLAFQLTPKGLRLLDVLVRVSRRSRVEVGCNPSCGRRVKRGRRVTLKVGKTLKPGSRLIVRVTRGGEIGAYFAYRIRKGRRPVETQRCIQPGVKKPRKTCP